MARITFVQPDGAHTTVDAAPGLSVMEAARNHGIDGIEAQCGGQCCCATCHCYVDPAWYPRLPPAADSERGLLDFAFEPRTTSRLTCQITVDEALDGMVLVLPTRQL